MKITVYVGIGNSDDKLSQRRWAEFVQETEIILASFIKGDGDWLGIWHSRPDDPWQNACFAIRVEASPLLGAYRIRIANLAGRYGQDSISWVEAPETVFLGPEWLKRHEDDA